MLQATVRLPTPGPSRVLLDETIFNYPGSDIALRSCDSRDFPLPKLYLVVCSPVLGNLIRDVSTTSDTSRGDGPKPLPVVTLPESGTTLYHLLTFIFPVDPVLPSTTEKIMGLLAVAQKYQMKSVMSRIRGVIARKVPPFILPETAHGIYFLAQMHGLREEVIQAARVTLRLPMTISDLKNKLSFPGLTGAYLHELWKYHKQVRSDLKSGVVEFKKSGLPDDVKHMRCEVKLDPPIVLFDESSHSPTRWIEKYVDSIADAPHLFDPVEFENDWIRHIKETSEISSKPLCSCVDLPSDLRRSFWKALTTFFYTTVEMVRKAGVTNRRRAN